MNNPETNKKEEILKLSKSVFQDLCKVIDDEKQSDRYLDHFELIPDNIEHSAVIFSINPSSTDIDTLNRPPDPCFIHFVYDEIKNRSLKIRQVTNGWNHGRNMHRLCYPSYFRRIYELFDQTTFYPMYCSSYYNQSWLFNVDHLKDEDKETLKRIENNDIKNFFICLDLIPYKQTNSVKIFQALKSNPEILKKLNRLLLLKIMYLRPVYTLIFLKRAERDFEETIHKINGNIKVFPFLSRYMSYQKYQVIKQIVEASLSAYKLPEDSNKWSYIG